VPRPFQDRSKDRERKTAGLCKQNRHKEGVTVTFTAVVLGLCVIVAGVVNILQSHRIDHVRNDLTAVRACVYNPAYRGVTPEDNRQLFLQCISDYNTAGR
jgi:hypothetical protein